MKSQHSNQRVPRNSNQILLQEVDLKKSSVRVSPVIVFIELLLTIINFVDGRVRVNSKDNCDANPPVKAAEFTKVLH